MGVDEYRRDEALAWDRYLGDTRGLDRHRYEQVEPWAWHRLTQALDAARYRLKARIAAGTA